MKKLTFFTLIMSALFVLAACGGSDDYADEPAETVATVRFESAGVSVDCPGTNWLCTQEFGGRMTLDSALGFGGIDVREIFKGYDQVGGLLAQPDWAGSALTEEYNLGDAQVSVLSGAANGRTGFVYLKDLGNKRYQCMVTVDNAQASAQKGNFETMCKSMKAL
jgi:hypothetical protein